MAQTQATPRTANMTGIKSTQAIAPPTQGNLEITPTKNGNSMTMTKAQAGMASDQAMDCQRLNTI
jgi:hypothetical protein